MVVSLGAFLSRILKGQAAGRLAGVVAAGGSGNTSICTRAFRDVLPIGFPKLMVSTMASGNVSQYVGETDITMMYSVVDIAGMNDILQVVLANAARAITGMAANYTPIASSQRAIAVSMFGVTTPCVNFATELLKEKGYDVVVFHATGAGGKAMERLIADGRFAGVLDVTTTELADELVGGVLTAGAHRLEAAAKKGVPQVVSVGALDMVNFGPRSTVPEKFAERRLHEHNESIALIRTTRAECEKLGEILSSKINAGSASKTRLVLPLRGISLLDVDGAPFHDAEADKALLDVLRARAQCPVVEVDADINDAQFARAAVDALMDMLQKV
ncbi:hypothetical protein PLICRDRAFT_40722 [Plicaturopsis crispa FD-325 SS-3]|nr:hypothetical protein PLICRDRAFT_40722 [Plicaturopsis crispa FD-325 SS-3]